MKGQPENPKQYYSQTKLTDSNRNISPMNRATPHQLPSNRSQATSNTRKSPLNASRAGHESLNFSTDQFGTLKASSRSQSRDHSHHKMIRTTGSAFKRDKSPIAADPLSKALNASIANILPSHLVKIAQIIRPHRFVSDIYFALIYLFKKSVGNFSQVIFSRSRPDWHAVQLVPKLSDHLIHCLKNFRKLCCQGDINEENINDVLSFLDDISQLNLDDVPNTLMDICTRIIEFLKNAIDFWDHRSPTAKKIMAANASASKYDLYAPPTINTSATVTTNTLTSPRGKTTSSVPNSPPAAFAKDLQSLSKVNSVKKGLVTTRNKTPNLRSGVQVSKSPRRRVESPNLTPRGQVNSNSNVNDSVISRERPAGGNDNNSSHSNGDNATNLSITRIEDISKTKREINTIQQNLKKALWDLKRSEKVQNQTLEKEVEKQQIEEAQRRLFLDKKYQEQLKKEEEKLAKGLKMERLELTREKKHVDKVMANKDTFEEVIKTKEEIAWKEKLKIEEKERKKREIEQRKEELRLERARKKNEQIEEKVREIEDMNERWANSIAYKHSVMLQEKKSLESTAAALLGNIDTKARKKR